MTQLIYKILTLTQWDQFARSGSFGGSEHDQRDGFIHLCSGAQVRGTLDKHYKNIESVILVGFEEGPFGRALKWEISRGGEKFPHLYTDLSFSALVNAHRLAHTPHIGFELPGTL